MSDLPLVLGGRVTAVTPAPRPVAWANVQWLNARLQKKPMERSFLLRLLHLSDIHFNRQYCLDPRTDRDRRVRDLMITDVERIVVQTQRPVEAILITGDIAYRGDREEYQVAGEWLDSVTGRLGLAPENVYTVPGNHDVDRDIAEMRIVKGIRQQVEQLNGERKEQHLIELLQDDECRQQLLRPMGEYNTFAARYQCEILVTPHPFWTHTIPLSSGYSLCLNGLTTTLFSGTNDAKGRLYMGAIQANPVCRPGIVNLAMYHHPVDWLIDGDTVEDALNGTMHLVFCGHKHRQRWNTSDHNIQLGAGATNPDRAEESWLPAYNIVDIEVQEKDGTAYLNAEGRLRFLQDDQLAFLSRQTKDNQDVFRHRLTLGPAAPRAASESNVSAMASSPGPKEEDAVIPTHTEKSIVYRFWKLPASARRHIVAELDLLQPEQKGLPEVTRYHIAIQAIHDRRLVEQFISMIEQAESNNGQ